MLEAYNTVRIYDFICIGKTYFNSSVKSDHDNLRINGYQLIQTDHPLNTTRGGVCISLQRIISCENDKYLLGCIAIIYGSPSQNGSYFEHFFLILNSYFSILKALSLPLQFY